MSVLLLGAILFVSLILIPLGLPGIWLIVGAALGYQILVPGSIGMFTVIGVAALAGIAEWLEFALSGSYARKYGGSRRASWGAIIGGLVGAFMGVPIPIIGSVIGAFVGAFAGALVGELTAGSDARGATRAATGALIGRVVAAALKVAIGVLMAVWVVWAAVI